jgi:hypothetical protein
MHVVHCTSAKHCATVILVSHCTQIYTTHRSNQGSLAGTARSIRVGKCLLGKAPNLSILHLLLKTHVDDDTLPFSQCPFTPLPSCIILLLPLLCNAPITKELNMHANPTTPQTLHSHMSFSCAHEKSTQDARQSHNSSKSALTKVRSLCTVPVRGVINMHAKPATPPQSLCSGMFFFWVHRPHERSNQYACQSYYSSSKSTINVSTLIIAASVGLPHMSASPYACQCYSSSWRPALGKCEPHSSFLPLPPSQYNLARYNCELLLFDNLGLMTYSCI